LKKGKAWNTSYDTSGAGMDNVGRMEKATKRREAMKRQRLNVTKAQSSMTRMSSDLAGLLISIGRIVQREWVIQRLRGRKVM